MRPDGKIDTERVRSQLGSEMKRRQWNGITMFKSMDKDGSRAIEKAEFVKAILGMGTVPALEAELYALWDEARAACSDHLLGFATCCVIGPLPTERAVWCVARAVR